MIVVAYGVESLWRQERRIGKTHPSVVSNLLQLSLPSGCTKLSHTPSERMGKAYTRYGEKRTILLEFLQVSIATFVLSMREGLCANHGYKTGTNLIIIR